MDITKHMQWVMNKRVKMMKVKSTILMKKYIVQLALWLGLIGVAGPVAAQFHIEKHIIDVQPALSGTAGHLDVTYQILVVNNSGALTTGHILDALDDPANLDGAFVGLVNVPPVQVDYVSMGSLGLANGSYDGLLAGDPQVASASLENGDTVIVSFTVEVDPLAGGGGPIPNSAVFDWLIDRVTSAPAILQDCWSDCVLACNNLVHVSVNSQCEVNILAQSILEGEDSACIALGIFEVIILDQNGDTLTPPLGSAYLGDTLYVSVKNIVCGNSCWGKILIEDKTAPDLSCGSRVVSCNASLDPVDIGFPIPVDSILNPNGPPPYIATGIDACGNVELTYRDSVVDRGCNDTSAIVYRKWKATDPSGYMAMCYDTIYLIRGNITSIDLPPHYDGVSVNPEGDPPMPPLPACGGTWTKFPNGFPDTSATGTGAPSGVSCGKIQFYFEDDTIETCGAGFKLLRHWIILDWCNPDTTLEYLQLIKIVDDDPPVIYCPGTHGVPADTVPTKPWSCTADYILPVPREIDRTPVPDPSQVWVISECSGWTYEVRHLPALSPEDCTPAPGGGTTDNIVQIGTDPATGLPIYKVVDMPLGCNWIYYRIIDECGHITECAYDIYVADKTKPAIACDQHTVVSLTVENNGQVVRVPAEVFDDGSRDNCAIDTMLVRRVNDNCGQPQNLTFRPYVEFCCNDLGRTNYVILKVIDRAGNMSQCTVKVDVQDKVPPIITYCPPDTTVTCGTDLSGDLSSRFGTVRFEDNCGATVEEELRGSVNQCGIGTLFRIFTVRDRSGLTTQCIQRIRVTNDGIVTRDDVQFPPDTTLINACGDDLSPDNLGYPTYPGPSQCVQMAVSREDRIFNQVDGACLKILREWSVLNWCTGQRWDTVQVIKVLNDVAPIIQNCQTQIIDITDGGCEKTITLTNQATDDCTPQSELRWSYEFIREDGVRYVGNRNIAVIRNVPVGRHTIHWTVMDGCDNFANCTQTVIVRDKKKPTPLCEPRIVTVFMETNGQATIWARDFDIKSFDNCTPESKLRYSFSPNVLDTGRVFTCDDIPNGISDTIDLRVYVTDEAGNQDYCNVRIVLQDNNNVCPDNLPFVTIEGRAVTTNNEPMHNATISLVDNTADQLLQAKTTEDGIYKIEAAKGHSVQLKAEFYTHPLLGVSTRDIIAIQKHILGIRLFDNPYHAIAADVSGNKRITGQDIVLIRNLILGKIRKYPNVPSWVVVPADGKYDIPFKPWPVKTMLDFSALDHSVQNADFVGVKMGDASGDVLIRKNGPRAAQRIVLYTKSTQSEGKGVYEIPVHIDRDALLEGLQFGLRLPGGVQLVKIQGEALPIRANEYFFHEAERPILTIAWAKVAGIQLQRDDVLFRIVVHADKPLQWDEIALHTDITPAEAFQPNGEGYEIGWKVVPTENSQLVLYQNIPNPFSQTTTIPFFIPQPSEVHLVVTDVSGKKVFSTSGWYETGMHQITIDLKNIQTAGVLYYTVSTPNTSATKKMVLIK